MIVEEVIDGQKVTVAFTDADGKPCEAKDAYRVEVHYPDGRNRIAFAKVDTSEAPGTQE